MEFFLFTTDLPLAIRAEKAGIDGIIVDWESRGKSKRQKGRNLEINLDTPEDVYKLSHNLKIPIAVRINPICRNSAVEIECALINGAKIIMLPMAICLEEVRKFLAIVDRKAKTIVQIETPSLARKATELVNLDWDYAYIGLNDLMVACRGLSIWQLILDGNVESICDDLRGRAYGFGGSTILGGGEPIINVLVLHELVRLGGSISIMRRTFKRELLDRDLDAEISGLREFVKCSEKRGAQAKLHDHEHLLRVIRNSLAAHADYLRE